MRYHDQATSFVGMTVTRPQIFIYLFINRESLKQLYLFSYLISQQLLPQSRHIFSIKSQTISPTTASNLYRSLLCPLCIWLSIKSISHGIKISCCWISTYIELLMVTASKTSKQRTGTYRQPTFFSKPTWVRPKYFSRLQ